MQNWSCFIWRSSLTVSIRDLSTGGQSSRVNMALFTFASFTSTSVTALLVASSNAPKRFLKMQRTTIYCSKRGFSSVRSLSRYYGRQISRTTHFLLPFSPQNCVSVLSTACEASRVLQTSLKLSPTLSSACILSSRTHDWVVSNSIWKLAHSSAFLDEEASPRSQSSSFFTMPVVPLKFSNVEALWTTLSYASHANTSIWLDLIWLCAWKFTTQTD